MNLLLGFLIIDDKLKPPTSVKAAASAVGSLPPIVSPALIPTAKTRLPKLELQKFKGNSVQ